MGKGKGAKANQQRVERAERVALENAERKASENVKSERSEFRPAKEVNPQSSTISEVVDPVGGRQGTNIGERSSAKAPEKAATELHEVLRSPSISSHSENPTKTRPEASAKPSAEFSPGQNAELDTSEPTLSEQKTSQTTSPGAQGPQKRESLRTLSIPQPADVWTYRDTCGSAHGSITTCGASTPDTATTCGVGSLRSADSDEGTSLANQIDELNLDSDELLSTTWAKLSSDLRQGHDDLNARTGGMLEQVLQDALRQLSSVLQTRLHEEVWRMHDHLLKDIVPSLCLDYENRFWNLWNRSSGDFQRCMEVDSQFGQLEMVLRQYEEQAQEVLGESDRSQRQWRTRCEGLARTIDRDVLAKVDALDVRRGQKMRKARRKFLTERTLSTTQQLDAALKGAGFKSTDSV